MAATKESRIGIHPVVIDARKPIDAESEAPNITRRLNTPNPPIPVTELEALTTLRFMSAFARVQTYVPILAERRLKEASECYRNSPSPIPVQPAPKTT